MDDKKSAGTSSVDRLLKVLDSLGDSVQFCSEGKLPPVLPGLEVKGAGAIGLPLTPADAKRLIAQASAAPYGRGEATIVDTRVRRVWQLETKQLRLRNPGWAAFVAGIVEAVRKDLGIAGRIEHQLYKLLVYEKGSFFAPHRDSEKVPGMFGTLVVGLPSRHAGGTLIVTHDGESKRIDFGGKDAEFTVPYAAFYADCEHEIQPLLAGYRACLVYNLSLPKRKSQPLAPKSTRVVDEVAALLPKIFADESRDKIAVALEHQYTEAALDPRALKGADRPRVAVLTRAAERLGYQAFLALMTHRQSGSVDYSTWDDGYSRSRRSYYGDYEDEDADGDDDDWTDGDDPDAEFADVDEESLTLDHWVDMDGHKQRMGAMHLAESEIASSVPADERPYRQEIQEATGNEGASMDRWYRQSVMVLWPAARFPRILAREGPACALPALEKQIAGTRAAADEGACLAFATAIVDRWGQGTRDEEGKSLAGRMLKQLARLGAADLAARFVREILPRDHDGTEGAALVRCAQTFGWTRFQDPLSDFFSQPPRDEYSYTPAAPVSIFEALCCGTPAMTTERRAACAALGLRLERLIKAWNRVEPDDDVLAQLDADDEAPDDVDRFSRPPGTRARPQVGIIGSIFRAGQALGDRGLLDRFTAHVLATPKSYDLHKVLVPAVQDIHSRMGDRPPAREGLTRLLDHCLTKLAERTARPVEPPADWTRETHLKCTCADCRALVAFMRSPTERVLRLPRRKDLRMHLHRTIDAHRLDLTHVTERKGSPQTLVCTKTQASYERRLAQFHVDVRLLATLRRLARPSRRRGRSAPTP